MKRAWPYLVIVVVLGAAGVGAGYLWKLRNPPPSPAPVVAAPAAPAPAPAPKPAVAMPPVGDADALMRAALERLSGSPLLAAWLKTEDLARRLVAGVEALAEGQSPRATWVFLAPAGKFEVETRNGHSFISLKSYQRYSGFAGVVASLDAQAVGKAYTMVRPLLEAAYQEIGRPGTTFDGRLAAAVKRILDAPVTQGPVEVVASPVIYKFADPALEALPGAAKHLVRMGPENQALIQAKVREIAVAMELGRPR